MFYTESLSVPTFGVCYPITTDALDALYEKVKPKGVTMTALLTKATAMALAQHPVVNASCKDSKSFTYNSNINIAVAVAINGSLITPVLQDVDKMDLYLLSQKWKELVEKARSKQLQPHEYNSETFTLSNLGMFRVDRFNTILPPGQGAIMVVGASKPTVVANADGFFSVKSKMLGIDWRAIMDEKARWFERHFERRKLSLQFLVMTGMSQGLSGFSAGFFQDCLCGERRLIESMRNFIGVV
ncbi:dihydrolipoyllysine-residue acetyltransferase component 4 of pyruvate dehydrogenase complex, chloroplastic [Morus notabilis]|uniref:dihydrolipoyllysine-residue acetyltransferase component 4 of pyruvate dehydrogenase complex, chloroplastic n=1 Tax=Morus notabilis TaxID=981085 RepID=UPI000CED2E37|nr:dihydrolipoyllysine-residue acetyltransferase component 4 of pyruvate dehydrogenase complex, chloroplastic [Morus notabilis]